MGHYLHAYLVGQSILNALVAWRQILSYKLCIVLLHEEETLVRNTFCLNEIIIFYWNPAEFC